MYSIVNSRMGARAFDARVTAAITDDDDFEVGMTLRWRKECAVIDDRLNIVDGNDDGHERALFGPGLRKIFETIHRRDELR